VLYLETAQRGRGLGVWALAFQARDTGSNPVARSMRLFIDDQKSPDWYNLQPEEIGVARTIEEALKLWSTGKYDRMYLDHDLGRTHTVEGTLLRDGYDLLKYILEHDLRKPEHVQVISWNFSGRQRIFAICQEHGVTATGYSL
jgi:hypothetical protein